MLGCEFWGSFLLVLDALPIGSWELESLGESKVLASFPPVVAILSYSWTLLSEPQGKFVFLSFRCHWSLSFRFLPVFFEGSCFGSERGRAERVYR